MQTETFTVEVQEIPRPAPRKRPTLRSAARPNPVIDKAVNRILGEQPQVTVAAFQSSI